MNIHKSDTKIASIGHSACPHDCPSTCALDIELLNDGTIGRVRGAKDNSYTDGVICAKVARYKERIESPHRLLKPQQRIGTKGEGTWRAITWEQALDTIAENFTRVERDHGRQAIWPYFYAGTMGLVQRDSIQRLRHAKGYSNQFDSFCTNTAWTGFVAGAGALYGPDPREMALADCVVIWGTNAVSTQVNVMTHAMKARKSRGAKIVAIDIYNTPTMQQADIKLILRPGTDGALACAVMHILFRDGYADHNFMASHADDPKGLEAHLKDKTPAWAAAITGLKVDEIEAFAKLLGTTHRSFLRLGYGFTRQRNGVANMHAAQSIATVAGHWQYEGGGAFHSNSGLYHFDQSAITGNSKTFEDTRHLDQSKIGRVLTGDKDALYHGPNVHAMIVQNVNPANVAPEQRLVLEGLARDDLFLAVHEQFMTDTARMADIVLPATMFMEHDDIYKGGGHQHIFAAPKLVDAPEGPRENIFVINELAKRLGVGDAPAFNKTARALADDMLQSSGYLPWDALVKARWQDVQTAPHQAHYRDGFAHADGKFHFSPDWTALKAPNRPPASMGPQGNYAMLPKFPDHVALNHRADAAHPFKLATSPARNFLNSSFAETKTSREKEGRPTVKIHADDAAAYGVVDGEAIIIGNDLGQVRLHAEITDDVKKGVLISEGLWPNTSFMDGQGINTLVAADAVAPYGGAAFHDIAIWLKKDC